MISSSRSVLLALALAVVTGCASPQEEESVTEGAALSGDSEVAMGLLLRCEGANDTKAELSIQKASDGSRITLLVQPLNGFFAIEYRGSDVGAVRDLGAGRAVSVPAELLSEFARRDMITVRPSGNAARLTVESAQHGDLELSCTYVD